jgi:hypothetical protein
MATGCYEQAQHDGHIAKFLPAFPLGFLFFALGIPSCIAPGDPRVGVGRQHVILGTPSDVAIASTSVAIVFDASVLRRPRGAGTSFSLRPRASIP